MLVKLCIFSQMPAKLFLIQFYVYTYVNTLLVQLINIIYLLQRFDAIKFYEILILIILI